MKLLAILACLIATAIALDSKGNPECLYCKNQDTKAGFLFSYSYCESKKLCVADAWDNFNLYCDAAWRDGWTLTLDEDCKANLTICESFQSAPMFSSQNVTGKRKLAAGEYCTI